MGKYPESFPDDFEERVLPKEASPESRQAYRVAKYGVKDPRSYLCSWDEAVMEEQDLEALCIKASEAERYSTSLFDDPDYIRHFLEMTMKEHPTAKIACGETNPICGPSLIGKRKKNRRTNTWARHISWWIYKDATPWVYFEEEVDECEENPS